MRLTPIQKPSSWLVRLGYWASRRMFGDVMDPMRVIYARFPRLLRAHVGLMRLMQSEQHLDRALVVLLETYVSRLNQCTFCADLHQASAMQEKGLSPEVHQLLAEEDPSQSSSLDARSRAALAYAKELTQTRDVSPETFAEAQQHFDEQALIELTWRVACTNYFNLMARPLGLSSQGFCAYVAKKQGKTNKLKAHPQNHQA